ncbi:MAG: fibronectin type III domain-containing protein, partial [Cellvibrionaceae bacterium]|nr:fibronectin type III domain-containing protein [Cellvibrionaceae bacterium]
MQYSEPLPDGLYRFCFEAFDFVTGRRLSAKGCATVYLVLNDPPILNRPQRDSEILARDPQNIIFQWTPRHLNATGVEYRFELRELWDEQIDPQAAFLASPNLYTATTQATTLLYGPGETPLLPDRTYGWRVRAVVTDGINETGLFRNNGYSEIFHFTHTTPCEPPRFALAKAKGPFSEQLSWQGDTRYKGYRIRLRKAGNDHWFQLDSQEPQRRIFHLQENTTYSYQIGGKCSQNGAYTYGAVQSFTTIGLQDPADYNCGVAPQLEITNQKPLHRLGVNETFTAGDFPVTVQETNGANGRFSGWGYITVPYLADTQLKVVFKNIGINTDYQLTQGQVYTEYDPKFATAE